MKTAVQRRGRRTARTTRGSAIVELAVVLPFYVLVIAGAVDLARVFYWSMELTDAARAGAQYGAQTPASGTWANDVSNIKSTAVSAAPDIPSFSTSDVSVTKSCACATNTGGPGASSVSCNTSSCAGHVVGVVSVTTSKKFKSVINLPFLTNVTPTATVTMRVAPAPTEPPSAGGWGGTGWDGGGSGWGGW
jgi:Flp pilus assembly protein TadG